MIYHLEVEARFCTVYGYLNGFPIYSLDATHPAIFSKPINAALVKENNKLELVVTSARPYDLDFAYSLNVNIKLYSLDQISGPDQGQVIYSEFREKTPLVSIIFDNEVFDYSSIFEHGAEIDDEEKVREYAWKLRTLLLQGSIPKLLPEFEVKLRDFAIAYSVDNRFFAQQFEDYMREKYYANSPKLDFSKQEIFLREWCKKRIWEIGIGADFQPFMSTEANDDGMEYVTRIFVSRVNNVLKIIR